MQNQLYQIETRLNMLGYKQSYQMLAGAVRLVLLNLLSACISFNIAGSLATQNTSSTTRGVCFTVVKLLYMTIINSSVVLTPRSLSLEDPLSYEDLEIPAVCVSVASLCRFCTLWGMWYSLKFGIWIIPLILLKF